MMEIKELSPEEIRKCLRGLSDSYLPLGKRIAHAAHLNAVKQMIEWGDEDCPDHAVEARKSIRRGLESIGRPPIYPRRECNTCWQELKAHLEVKK